MSDELVISEVFGPTIQGEGPSTGRRCAFVRLGRCNLSCSWCDTPFTWDWRGQNGTAFDPAKELAKASIGDIVEHLTDLDVRLVVISGGEPMAQRDGLTRLVVHLRRLGFDVEIETNGTFAALPMLAEYVTRWNVSPKLANSGMDYDRRINEAVLADFATMSKDRVALKFVVTTLGDFAEIDELVDVIHSEPHKVWIMPEGACVERLERDDLGAIADAAIARGYNVTDRLHVRLWHGERAR